MARWGAAMVVFLGHLRNPLAIGWPNLTPEHRHLWVIAWYFITGLDHEAVIVFFVLSGFLVGGMSMRKVGAGRFSLPEYGVDRVARLFIAFIPAVLLGVALDLIGSQWFGWTGLWNHGHDIIRNNFPDYVFADNLTPLIIGGNLVMLQTFKVPPVGSNLPLWTLSYEFWFYVVFACFAYAMATRRILTSLVGAALVVAILFFLGKKLPLLMVMWIVGTLAFMYRGALLRRPWLALIAFAGALVFSRFWAAANPSRNLTEYLSDYLVAVTFGWVLIGWRHYAGPLLEKVGGFNRTMADFSYSLYLIHFPMMLFTLAILATVFGIQQFPRGFNPDDPVMLALYAATVVIVILVSFVFSQLTEKHTGALRAMLKARLAQSPA